MFMATAGLDKHHFAQSQNSPSTTTLRIGHRHNLWKRKRRGVARRAFMPSTSRGTALEAESEVPYPSCPSALAPQLNTAPPSTSAAVCLFAAATAKARCRSVVTLPHHTVKVSSRAGAGVTLNSPVCDPG